MQQALLSTQAGMVSSDTQDQSAVVFAFALMFGIRLWPVRNWNNLTFVPAGSVFTKRSIPSLLRNGRFGSCFEKYLGAFCWAVERSDFYQPWVDWA
jgi:hypothetical protein